MRLEALRPQVPFRVPARPAAPEAPCVRRPLEEPPADPLHTNWGFGRAENYYNRQIEGAAERWPDSGHPLSPRLYKALIGVESAFDTTAVSRSGAAGLVQLMPGTAVRHGLSLSPVDERMVPNRALPVGVAVLAEKHGVITNPNPSTSYGAKVADAYRQLGPPSGDDLWRLDLAGYNGGGGTVLRAMANAWDRGLDPRAWENLTGPADRPRESPLYAAVREVFGETYALGKYYEMARYPGKILALRDRA